MKQGKLELIVLGVLAVAAGLLAGYLAMRWGML